jgi:predicted lipoprotein
MRPWIPALIALLCLAACTKSVDDIKWKTKRELLATLPERVIIPTYRGFAETIVSLRISADRYCAAPQQAGLEALREHWRSAMTAWQRTAAYAVGPVAQYDLPALINYPAIRASKVEYWLAPGRLATPEEIKNYSVQGRGLGALEYLLFEPEIARGQPQYCAYLAALAVDLAANAGRILEFWQQPDTPATTDEPNSGIQQRLDELLNAALQSMEAVKDEKLGVPLGKKSNGVAQPDKVESRRSGHALQNIRANMVAMRNLFYGAADASAEQGLGLSDYLRATGSAEVATDLEAKLQRAMQDLERIPATLQQAVLTHPATVHAVHHDVAELCSLLETAVLRAFDSQPGFNARDGD